MNKIKSNARIKNEDLTLISRVAYERLTYADIKEVFGQRKADKWLTSMGNLTELWYRASAIEQSDLLEIMNDYVYVENQSVHASKGEQL